MSLRVRLILSFIFIIVLCLAIVAGSLLVLSENYRDRVARARLGDIAAPVYFQVQSLARGQVSLDQVWASLNEQSQKTGTAIIILNSQGKVIRQLSPEGRSWRYPANLPESELPGGDANPSYGTYTTSQGQEFLFVAYPLQDLFRSREGAARPQTLILAIPRGDALALWANFTRPLLWAGLIALVVSVIIAVFLARSFYAPIRRITYATQEIARGEYDQQIPVNGPEEVKGLARSFNQMSQQVRHSQQMLRDFVADVSHELRSPLTSIKGFALAILDGTAKDRDAQLKAAGIIEDESARMMRMVNDLLELSRIESGQISMVREPVDIGELLHQCQELFAVRAEEKGIHFETDIESIPVIMADTDRLEQVLNNLLDNAIKHTFDNGTVSIIAKQAPYDYIAVVIADTGPGISQGQLSNVFERFYKADSSTVKTGTGLGLAISREIARAHGGDIQVNSVVGEGTKFIVRLPVRADMTAAQT
ncbi:sensor histidine kinase [Chloroflexota bacterium]